jgi:hypothetical protein
MARILELDFHLATWYSETDWCKLVGRSITRWGSANNFSTSSEFSQPTIALTYNPAQSVDVGIVYIDMSKVRAILGFRSIILSALWIFKQGDVSPTSGVKTVNARAFIKDAGYPDIDDATTQYKDSGSVVGWSDGGYSPQLGKDVEAAIIDSVQWDSATVYNVEFGDNFEMKEYLSRILLDNEDWWVELTQITSSDVIEPAFNAGSGAVRPRIEIQYHQPIEMFPTHPTINQPDLARLLNIDSELIDLGAYQKNVTGTGIKFWLKNMSLSAVDFIEVWDDHPQWTPPEADAANAGTADVDYVELFENCVSQRWEVQMLTVTTFEVKATAYLDNVTSLHPAYDAAPAWQGAVGTNWDSPDTAGSVRIPTAAWSGTAVAADLFVFYTRGQTTNTAWPADGNEQVEICGDNAGAPDGDWRPVNGRRIQTTASVTIDAASKVFAVEHIDVTDWPTNTKCFVYSGGNLDEGYVSATGANSVTIAGMAVSSNVHAAGAIIATTMPFESLAASPWALLTTVSGSGETNPDRLYIANANTYGFTGGKSVFVQSLVDPNTSEYVIINTVQTTYLDLVSSLVNDYEVGALVVELGTGEIPFWIRVVTLAVTDEEKKKLRLNIIA